MNNNRHTNLIISLFVAAVLSACDGSVVVPATKAGLADIPMDISALVDVMKVKSVVNGVTFPTDRTFVLSANLMAAQGGDSFLREELFSYAAAKAAWTPSQVRYWPPTAGLEMLAYSAGSATVSSSWTGASQVTLSCTDCTKDDILAGGLTNARPASKNMVFKHVLAKMSFRVSGNVASAVTVKKLSMMFNKGADITVTKASGSSDVAIATSLTGSATDNVLFNGSKVVTTTASALKSDIVVPSQTPSSMKITYTLNNGTGESQSMSVTKSLTQELVSGKAYTFDIVFSVNGITVLATLTDWDDGGTTYAFIPDKSFGGLYLAHGPLYYDGASYAIHGDWNHASYKEVYGEQAGSTYFSFVEMGRLFESPTYTSDDGDILNLLEPLGDWRLPTYAEWLTLTTGASPGSVRTGSTVNGSAGKRYVHVQLADVTHCGRANPAGVLLFPDDCVITVSAGGAQIAASNFDNKKAMVTGMTGAELDAALSQGCVFLPASGRYKEAPLSRPGWNYICSQGNYWSSSEDGSSVPYDLIFRGDTSGMAIDLYMSTDDDKEHFYGNVWLVKDI